MASSKLAPLLVLSLSLGCSGHVVRNAPNHPGAPFDFERPPCTPAARPPESPNPVVDVRYLGASGLYLRWGDDSVLLGPFFSNPGLLHALFGHWRADAAAVERGLAGIDVAKVEGILAGHSHYDHIGDLPVVLDKTAAARVFVNRSGAHALAPYAAARTTALEEGAGQWVWLTRSGERRPIRFFAVVSSHAPAIDHLRWAPGSVRKDWREPWSGRYFHDLREGQTFALVIDLMAADLATVRYRIYYQDAANRQGIGEPPSFPDGHPYDLAVLCIASYDKAPGQPAALLRVLRPRHVLVAHYDDFFRKQTRPVRFVNLLTDAKVERYLETICRELGCAGPSGAGPVNRVCGPSAPRWTLPLPGEWMRFQLPATSGRP